MSCYSRSHVTNDCLVHSFTARVTLDRSTTADLLADLGEVDVRKLYSPAGYSSMYLYCVHEFHMSEDTAYRRIGVARTARQFPAIFPALADGRLNMTAVLLLAPHLTPGTADELLTAATHKTKVEINLLLAERFPQPDMPTLICANTPAAVTGELALRPVAEPSLQLAPERVVPSGAPDAPVRMVPVPGRTKLDPLSPGRYAMRLRSSRSRSSRSPPDRAGRAVPRTVGTSLPKSGVRFGSAMAAGARS